MATLAIMRSEIRPRVLRPAARTAAQTWPKARAASASKGSGSNADSARCSRSSRRARSRGSSVWCGPADSSARVIALMDMNGGSSVGSSCRRRIRMLVSSNPWPLAGIGVSQPVVDDLVEVGLEPLGIDNWRVRRRRGELLAGDRAVPAQRDQLADRCAAAGDDEGLAVFNLVHDLPRS